MNTSQKEHNQVVSRYLSGSYMDVDSKSALEAKSQLESLGFMINNGKPKFKLDEPVSATSSVLLNQSTCNQAPIDFSLLEGDDTLSFVVLDKNSLDSIKASSLATYNDIQKKCMPIDHNSVISSLSSSEIQQKVTEVLQENVKLKETLKQNTMSMKQQFNMLVAWQEQVMNVHKHHKQKFAETKQLINNLKQENTELKLRLSTSHFEMIENDHKIADTDVSISVSSEKIHASPLFVDKLKKLETNIAKNESQVQDVDQLTTLLEEKLKFFTALLQQNVEEISNSSMSSNREDLIQNVKKYIEIIHELNDCFIAQISRYFAIQKCLKECTDMLEIYENADILAKLGITEGNSPMSLIQSQTHKEKLSVSQKQLIDEQLKLITDKQTLIKILRHFQNIFSDYNNILNELQIMSEENNKLSTMKNSIVREYSLKLSELQECKTKTDQMLEEERKILKQEKEKLEEERKLVKQEKEKLEEEKKLLNDQKESLDTEYKSLIDEKEVLEQERTTLHEEKTSLDQQSQLYESSEKILLQEKKALEESCKQLLVEINTLRKSLTYKEINLKQLHRQTSEQAEEIKLLKMQISYNEQDFICERKTNEKLLAERNKLQKELETLMNISDNITATRSSQTFSCPQCVQEYNNIKALEEHVEDCLQLH